jgi:rubredoxin
MKVWQCLVCSYIYDEAMGDEDHGIAPGTAWADVPDDFVCPECQATKADFVMVEI